MKIQRHVARCATCNCYPPWRGNRDDRCRARALELVNCRCYRTEKISILSSLNLPDRQLNYVVEPHLIISGARAKALVPSNPKCLQMSGSRRKGTVQWLDAVALEVQSEHWNTASLDEKQGYIVERDACASPLPALPSRFNKLEACLSLQAATISYTCKIHMVLNSRSVGPGLLVHTGCRVKMVKIAR
jgi:hypothetical protein